jgi:hypothetical protein
VNSNIDVDISAFNIETHQYVPAKQAAGVGSEVGSDSAMFLSKCRSCGEESI